MTWKEEIREAKDYIKESILPYWREQISKFILLAILIAVSVVVIIYANQHSGIYGRYSDFMGDDFYMNSR